MPFVFLSLTGGSAMDAITHQVLLYQYARRGAPGTEIQESLMERLYLHIYSFPGMKHSLKEEDRSDFLLGFLRKLPDVLMNFEYRGFSFLCYLNCVLEWQVRSWYSLNEASRRDCWVSEREALIEYGCCREEEGLPLKEKLECVILLSGLQRRRLDSFRQRLILFVLKNVALVEEGDFLQALAFLGVNPVTADEQRRILLKTLECRFLRKERLTAKRNECYCRYNLATKKLSEAAGADERSRYVHRSDCYRKRLRRLELQIASVPLSPSNECLAGLLGIPKGSVDSGLYYLRRSLTIIEKQSRRSGRLQEHWI